MSTKWPYLLLTLMTLILLAAGIFIGWNHWITVVIVAVPVGFMISTYRSSNRQQIARTNNSEISSTGAVSEGQVRLDTPIGSVPAVVESAVAGMRRFKLRSLSADGAEIRVSITFKTWGETITLKFEDAGSNMSRITATCRPLMKSTAVDYGQGRQDIRELFQACQDQRGFSNTSRSNP